MMVLFALLWVLGSPQPAQEAPALPEQNPPLRYGQITLFAIVMMALSAPLSHLFLFFLF